MRIEPVRTPAAASFAQDVRAGLARSGQKELPSKYLYDDVGSALFDVIALLPEYGLTRAGERLLRRHADDILDRVAPPVVVAELGCGNGKKTRWILQALSRRQATTYYPIEISPAALERCELELSRLDAVSVVGFEKEYLEGLLEVTARRRPGQQLLVLFLGSTIGNFDRPAGEAFLRELRRLLRADDALLLATDLVKPVPQLLLAYDDPIGVTAAFNLNLLARVNRELGADFDLRRFRHEIRYDEDQQRVEMHLRSLVAQRVSIPAAGITVGFEEGETIWTESSHKFRLDDIPGMARKSGFECVAQWVDREWPFAQNLFLAR